MRIVMQVNIIINFERVNVWSATIQWIFKQHGTTFNEEKSDHYKVQTKQIISLYYCRTLNYLYFIIYEDKQRHRIPRRVITLSDSIFMGIKWTLKERLTTSLTNLLSFTKPQCPSQTPSKQVSLSAPYWTMWTDSEWPAFIRTEISMNANTSSIHVVSGAHPS